MQNIQNVFLTASTSERKNQLSLAYKQYIFCIKEAMNFLGRNSFQTGAQQTCTMYFTVVEKCTERLKAIYPSIVPKDTKVPLQPQNFPQQPTRTMPSPTTPQTQQQVYGTGSISQPTPRSIQQPSTGRSSVGSPGNSEDLKGSYGDLRKMMKAYENAGIGKMNDESILKRQFNLQARTNREMNKQANKLRRSLRSSFYGGSRWKRDNQWATFIQKNFHYMKMNNDMLLKDKSFMDMIGKTPTGCLFPHVKPKQQYVPPQKPGGLGGMDGPPAYSLPSLSLSDEERKRTISDEIEVFVEKYLLFDPPHQSPPSQPQLVGVHKPRKHQLLVLTDRFIAYLRDTYFIPRKITKQDLNVANLREDVRSFTHAIVGFLLGKLWRLSDELCQNILSEKLISGLHRAIFRYIQNFYITIDCRIVMKHKASMYRNSPSDTVLELCFEKYKKNETFNQKIKQFVQHFGILPIGHHPQQRQRAGPKFTLKHLRMKKKYRLERLEEPYVEVIKMFQDFSEQGFIVDKLELTQRCLKQVSKCVNEYFIRYHPEKKEPPPVGAEELLPIFVYCLIKSRSLDMMFVFYYIESFLTDDLIRGILGYSLATLETSLSYIWERLTIEEMLESEQILNQKEGGGDNNNNFGSGSSGDVRNMKNVVSGELLYPKIPNQQQMEIQNNRSMGYPNVQQPQIIRPMNYQQPRTIQNNNKPVSYHSNRKIMNMTQQQQPAQKSLKGVTQRGGRSGGREYKIPKDFDISGGEGQLDDLYNVSAVRNTTKNPQQQKSQTPQQPKSEEDFFLEMSSTLDGLLGSL